ncbi:hypothetical protein [Arthrobacter sp. MYb224]|nr:hypothetical protein [Arthrobacter sp. MYb224]
MSCETLPAARRGASLVNAHWPLLFMVLNSFCGIMDSTPNSTNTARSHR